MDNPHTHTDYRGTIRDVLQEDVDSVTLVEFKADAIRGNHYHKLTTQWSYILWGVFNYVTPSGEESVCTGDTVKTLPNTPHAFQGTGMMIVMSKGPRRGSNYEDDTYRLAYPLI